MVELPVLVHGLIGPDGAAAAVASSAM